MAVVGVPRECRYDGYNYTQRRNKCRQGYLNISDYRHTYALKATIQVHIRDIANLGTKHQEYGLFRNHMLNDDHTHISTLLLKE